MRILLLFLLLSEPNYDYELCVIFKTARWFNTPCDFPNNFVCDGGVSLISAPTTSAATSPPTSPPTAPPTVKKQIIRLKVTSDENVNDPEVQKKVLEKIQQILKMKGLDGNATLSWRKQSDGNVFQKHQENNVTQQICH